MLTSAANAVRRTAASVRAVLDRVGAAPAVPGAGERVDAVAGSFDEVAQLLR